MKRAEIALRLQLLARTLEAAVLLLDDLTTEILAEPERKVAESREGQEEAAP